MAIDMSSDVDRVARSLDDLGRRQLPFAISRTINATLFDIRRHQVEHTFPTAFDLRNKSLPRVALRVEVSTKLDLTGRLFDRLNLSYLEKHARGGVKIPIGRHLAIPTNELRGRRGAKGMPKNLRPRQVLNKPKAFRQKVRGQDMILQRTGRKRLPVKPLYVMEPRARLPKRLAFYEDGARVFVERVGFNFSREFDRAVGTAKRR